MDEDAASEPVMVLDEAEQTAVEDIPALENFQPTEVKAVEPDCAAQVATEELHEMPDNAEKQIVEGVAEKSAELCDEDASEPMMEKAEAKVPREATQTAVNKIPALNF